MTELVSIVPAIEISTDTIVEMVSALMDSKKEYEAMSKANNPYGDGRASQRIVENIIKTFR